MNYILLVVILHGPSISTNTLTFKDEVSCLKAIDKILDLEKTKVLTVKATCFKM